VQAVHVRNFLSVMEVKDSFQTKNRCAERNELKTKMHQLHQEFVFKTEDTVDNHSCEIEGKNRGFNRLLVRVNLGLGLT